MGVEGTTRGSGKRSGGRVGGVAGPVRNCNEFPRE